MSPIDRYIKDEIQSRAVVEELKRMLCIYDKQVLIAMVNKAERDARLESERASEVLMQRLKK